MEAINVHSIVLVTADDTEIEQIKVLLKKVTMK